MDLLPCPFCGATEDFEFRTGTPDREGIPTNIYCSYCGAEGPWVYVDGTTEPAIERWNSRTTKYKKGTK